MPFDAIKCTNCGSIEVQELKQGTFFCHHCEALFKHIDPTRITVQPGFCTHGEPVQVQCLLCHTGMCRRKCDFAAWVSRLGCMVPMAGFGYLFKDRKAQIMTGPVLFLGDLLRYLKLTHGELSHVCYACLMAAVPGTVEGIAAGAICEKPGCDGAPGGRCACCAGSFCGSCAPLSTGRPISGASVHYPDEHTKWDDYHKNIAEGSSGYYHYPVPAEYVLIKTKPARHCVMCAHEAQIKAQILCAEIAAREYAGILIPDDNNDKFARELYFGSRFKVPYVARATRRGRMAENERAMEVAKRCAGEIASRVSPLLPTGPCDRQRAFLAGETDDRWFNYVIFDERDRVPAAAAGEMTQP
jgi:hypothetical protein